jgi:hypothetical protein
MSLVVYLKERGGWCETREYQVKDKKDSETVWYLQVNELPNSAAAGTWAIKTDGKIYLQKGVAKHAARGETFLLSRTVIGKKTNKLLAKGSDKKKHCSSNRAHTDRIHQSVLDKFGWRRNHKDLGTLIRCPLHDDKHPSAKVYIASGSLRCFTCKIFIGYTKFFEAMKNKYSDIYVDNGQLMSR